MGKTKDLGHLAHIVAYDSENHITVPAGITMHTNQLVASQAYVDAALGSYALSSSLSSYVPTSRTITINGTTYDLSANREWNITSMIYPAAGISLSTGSAWGTSITNNSANWNTAYGWGNHASAGYLTGINSSQVTTALGFTPVTNARTITINNTTFDLSANRSWTITATETDTLATVTARGATTSEIVTFTSTTTAASVIARNDGNGAAWRGRIGHFNATADRSVWLATYNGNAVVGVHNNALTAWADLYVNTVDGNGGGTVRMPSSTFINGSQAIHAGNYNSYAPTLTGGNASGTWAINISGTAAAASAVAWGNVSSKPSHIMYYQSFTLDANTMDVNATGFTYSVNAPYTGPIVRFSAGGSYDLWLNATYGGGGNSIAFRTRNGDAGAYNPWREIIHTGNIGSQKVDGSLKLWATSHPSDYYIVNNWTGTYWRLTTNHGSGVQVAYADSAGSAPASGGTATALNSSNYINRASTSGNLNTDFQNTPAGTYRYNGDDANVTNSPGNAWWFYENMRHSNAGNYWGTQIAWGWEDNANRLAQRNITANSFSGWVYYLNSGNYTSYYDYGRLNSSNIYNTGWFRNYGDSGLYNQDYGCHIVRNGQSSHGAWSMFGYTKAGYIGMNLQDPSGYNNNLMYEGGNGGMYTENANGWQWYYNRGSNCIGLGGSTTYNWVRAVVNGKLKVESDSIHTGWAYFDSNVQFAGGGNTFYNEYNYWYVWRNWGGWGGEWINRNGGDMIMNLYAVYSVTGSISDIRYKKDVTALTYGLNEIMQLNPIKYHYNLPKESMLANDPDYFLGFSAQEVQQIIPEAVHEKVGESTDSMKGMLAITMDEIIPVLVNGIKEQQVMIRNQNNKINKLEALVNQLLNN